VTDASFSGNHPCNTKEAEMPALSRKQQNLMATAYRHKKNGTLPDEPHLRRLVEDMSEEDLRDFASTKHADLPERVEKAASDGYEDGYLQKIAAPPAGAKLKMRSTTPISVAPLPIKHPQSDLHRALKALVSTASGTTLDRSQLADRTSKLATLGEKGLSRGQFQPGTLPVKKLPKDALKRRLAMGDTPMESLAGPAERAATRVGTLINRVTKASGGGDRIGDIAGASEAGKDSTLQKVMNVVQPIAGGTAGGVLANMANDWDDADRYDRQQNIARILSGVASGGMLASPGVWKGWKKKGPSGEPNWPDKVHNRLGAPIVHALAGSGPVVMGIGSKLVGDAYLGVTDTARSVKELAENPTRVIPPRLSDAISSVSKDVIPAVAEAAGNAQKSSEVLKAWSEALTPEVFKGFLTSQEGRKRLAISAALLAGTLVAGGAGASYLYRRHNERMYRNMLIEERRRARKLARERAKGRQDADNEGAGADDAT